MDTRMHSSTVIFRRPFTLSGLDGVQPAGTYNVETREELLDTTASCAYRRISTSIGLHGQPAGIIRTATIDPQDLEAALAQDVAGEAEPPARMHVHTEPHAVQRSNVTMRLRKMFGHVHEPKMHWMASQRTRGSGAVDPTTKVFSGLTRWTTLNANELTWIVLVVGVFMLSSFIR